MSILVCNGVNIDAAGETILHNISFRIEAGQKAGLIGANGAGKTTLLRALVQEIPCSRGEIFCTASIGYLPQAVIFGLEEGTVFDSMLAERKDIIELREKMRFLEIRMAQEAEEQILEQYSTVMSRFENAGGYALEAQIRRILAGLGLEKEKDKLLFTLSGGQKTRLRLGRILLRKPDLLILDEPTNHLDLDALEWLEGFLGDYEGAVLIVSHDRFFLDKILDTVFFVKEGKLTSYKGNYSEFELQRKIEEISGDREAEKTAKKIRSLEEYVRRYKAGVKAKQAHGREIQLQKLTASAVKTAGAASQVSISFGETARSGDRVLAIEDLAVTYNNKRIFQNAAIDLRRGQKVALLGKNGVGKTSLLKAILGKINHEGRIRLGANVKVSYYAQEHEDFSRKATIIEEIRDVCKMEDPAIRALLGRYGFRGDDVFKQVKVLSGGEKSRLALCKLLLANGNLLLLDEPTNHLDAETREMLEEALIEYEGTVLVVSHDRYFLNRIINEVALLTPEGIRLHRGDYLSFRQAYAQWSEQEKDQQAALAQEKDVFSARNYREEAREQKRKDNKLKQLESKISEHEKKLQEIEGKMEGVETDYREIITLQEEHDQTKAELDKLMEYWLEISEQVHH
ncbi:ABC transporter related protein [Syntrophobotulus glycolicus DSM 8271]|uniref:ABC transporter related protein n=1 Tax=Syntrophobotulus glycolicus (strain DSM 8271 / FlGlyR) TaxID=645991 RepID=F0T2Q6_SYNGF|nr:ABC-F family ATP-binding cassette domain-containing protein [Syntrophobotulus glycolicus]ADY56455.1 ABC transporter related protein [Syntrophobotulus glycolicus DSM 8271]